MTSIVKSRESRANRRDWLLGMASFSPTHPFAYHAFPLTAARSIWTTGALLGKDDQGSAGQARRTVADTDRRLGFSRYVHLYLPRRGTTPAALPILAAQLQPARDPACPHALLIVPTDNLADADCSLCNWNIAVSRPGVPGVAKGGNWTRGTNPERIAEVWRAFRPPHRPRLLVRPRGPDPRRRPDRRQPAPPGPRPAEDPRAAPALPGPRLRRRHPPRLLPRRPHLPTAPRPAPGRRHPHPRRVPRLRPRRRPPRPAPPAPRRLPRRPPPRPPKHRFRRHPPQTARVVTSRCSCTSRSHRARAYVRSDRRWSLHSPSVVRSDANQSTPRSSRDP